MIPEFRINFIHIKACFTDKVHQNVNLILICTFWESKFHFPIFSTSETDYHNGRTEQRLDLYIQQNAQ